MEMLKPHVVILGSGFGGTYVAKRLARFVKKGLIDLTIVNKTNYFLFTPLLHEVATGSLSPTTVAEPIREIFANTGIELYQGQVQAINTIDRRVHIKTNDLRHTILYDYLVIATGAESNYYNIPGAEQFSMPLKNLQDAVNIRSRIIDVFEQANNTEDPNERKALLTFAVVGGGPTGVEMVAEMAEFIQGIVNRYYKGCSSKETLITLVHTGPELLQQLSEPLRKRAADRLEKNGVQLALGKTVIVVSAKSLTLSDGSIIPAMTIIWAAGVKAIIPEFENEMPPLVGGRLKVDEYFRVNGDERVFALGDVASYTDGNGKEEPKPVPMLAQAAVKQARRIARNVIASTRGKKLKSFHFNNVGTMVSVGQWFAIGEVLTFKISGRFTWWLWRTAYLFKFASWRKRIRISFEWGIGLLYSRDITKLN